MIAGGKDIKNVKTEYPKANIVEGKAYNFKDKRFNPIGKGFAVDLDKDNKIDFFILSDSILPSTDTIYNWKPSYIFHEKSFEKDACDTFIPEKRCWESSPPFNVRSWTPRKKAGSL